MIQQLRQFIHIVESYTMVDNRPLRLFRIVVERKRVAEAILAKYPGLKHRRVVRHGEPIDVYGSSQTAIDMALVMTLQKMTNGEK